MITSFMLGQVDRHPIPSFPQSLSSTTSNVPFHAETTLPNRYKPYKNMPLERGNEL